MPSRSRPASSCASDGAAVCPETPEKSEQASSFPIVGVGASAGGLEALGHFLEHLTPDIGMAYVVVQHLAPKHKSLLAELLQRKTGVPIQEVRQRTRIRADHIYVIPPNRNMYVEKGELCLCARNRNVGREMPIDYLFRTLALDQPGNCIGIVLSGTGSDGAMGVEEIKAAGGITFAQDQNSAKYDGMPRAAVSTGSIDYVLPPEAIGLELKRIAKHPFTGRGNRIAEQNENAMLDRVFSLLKSRTSVDFKHYKQSTIRRRIYRRMALLKVETLAEYLPILSGSHAEVDALYHDILIKVTCFFRETPSFQVLHDDVFPLLMRNRSRQDPIRLWVPGCSTGEEVYSLAIALLEALGEGAGSIPIQIFGTDVSDVALEKARSGLYIENIALDVSPERLRRWFIRVDRGYQISKDIREMCVFARQNVISDPPFSKIDLISCRNLLIYFDTVFQARVMPIFHYALKAGGHLMLGNSESVGSHLDLFTPIDKKSKIYLKKSSPHQAGVSFRRTHEEHHGDDRVPMPSANRPPDIQNEADRFIVSRFAPSGVIVDDDLKIIQFRGSTGEYLEPAPGRAVFHLLKMARGNLPLELRAMVQKARSSGAPVRREGFGFQSRPGVVSELNLEVAPLRTEAAASPHFLVLFESVLAESATAPHSSPIAAREADSPEETREREMTDLRKELATTKSYLQSTVEDAEATNEELKSANEEIMSSNEELQSTNEELETAKEELQSANEELTTVNEEVQTRNGELNQLNNDLKNFLGSVSIPIVMLGTDLRIRRFTPMTQRVFNLIPTDIGRPFGDIKPKVDVPHLDRLIAKVIDSVIVHEEEVRDDEGRYYTMSIRPYRTPENKIDGAVLVFIDIDSIKRSALQAEGAQRYAESIVESVINPLLILDENLTVRRANPAYYHLFGSEPVRIENHSLFSLDRGQWDTVEIRQLLQNALKRGREPLPLELTARFSGIGERTLVVHARRVVRRGSPTLLMLTLCDITQKKQHERERAALASALEQEQVLFEEILRQVPVGVALFDAPEGKLILANKRLRGLLGKKLPAGGGIRSFHRIAARHPHDGPIRNEEWPMHRSLADGEIVEGQEIVFPGREGTVLQISSSPVYDKRRKMVAVVALFHDITDRKKIERQIVEISAREQRRIGHDLHDGIGQELAAVTYRVRALEGRFPQEKKMTSETKEIRTLLEATLARTRDLAKFLQPVAVDSTGLMESLRELARTTTRLYRIDCSFKAGRAVLVPDPEVAHNVFRIAQEAIHNAVRHGKPGKLEIGLRRREERVELSVSNNGKTFAPGGRKGGMGLHIMEYRARLMGAEFSVRANTPRGTVVQCVFQPKVRNGR